MPVLYKYKNRNEFYILTGLNGTIVTFQITGEGLAKLEQAAVTEGEKFSRSLLLDLYKSGDAYTRSTAPDIDLSGWVQTTLDFSDDTEPESSMPVCAACGSPYGLHLVSCHEPDKDAYLSIRCEECCVNHRHSIGICVPTPALTRPLWNRLMGLCNVAVLDHTAVAYQELLERNFMEKLSKGRGEPRLIQNSLFEPDQGSLL